MKCSSVLHDYSIDFAVGRVNSFGRFGCSGFTVDSLGGIQSLNKGLASQLIAFKGILYLTGVTQLNKETAEQLVKKSGAGRVIIGNGMKGKEGPLFDKDALKIIDTSTLVRIQNRELYP